MSGALHTALEVMPSASGADQAPRVRIRAATLKLEVQAAHSAAPVLAGACVRAHFTAALDVDLRLAHSAAPVLAGACGDERRGHPLQCRVQRHDGVHGAAAPGARGRCQCRRLARDARLRGSRRAAARRGAHARRQAGRRAGVGVHALLTLHEYRCIDARTACVLLGYLAWVTPPAQIAYSRVLLALQVALQREVVQILGSIADTATTILRGSAWSSTHKSLQGCPGLALSFAEGSLIGPTSKNINPEANCIGFSCQFLDGFPSRDHRMGVMLLC